LSGVEEGVVDSEAAGGGGVLLEDEEEEAGADEVDAVEEFKLRGGALGGFGGEGVVGRRAGEEDVLMEDGWIVDVEVVDVDESDEFGASDGEGASAELDLLRSGGVAFDTELGEGGDGEAVVLVVAAEGEVGAEGGVVYESDTDGAASSGGEVLERRGGAGGDEREKEEGGEKAARCEYRAASEGHGDTLGPFRGSPARKIGRLVVARLAFLPSGPAMNL
jgi:hypothetical protein